MPLPRPFLALATLLCTLAWAGPGQAQPVYRIVGPDGKVTFSDRAPGNDAEPARAGRAGAAPEAGQATALPYELRQIATRFPVTLYTGADCTPCASARNLLVQRGVPFTERTVASNEDIDALQRLSGGSSLPFGTIGGQQLTGFSDSEWTQYLDAAGYPKQSQLPPQYRRAAPTPLVAIQRTSSPAPATAAAPGNAPPAVRQEPAVPRGPTPPNPAGIRF
ncbi:NrdH-redoxin [Rhodococcus sp. SRB_17]|nr:NrdH-redoxin [Rhodococcus sp. SRB_17]